MDTDNFQVPSGYGHWPAHQVVNGKIKTLDMIVRQSRINVGNKQAARAGVKRPAIGKGTELIFCSVVASRTLVTGSTLPNLLIRVYLLYHYTLLRHRTVPSTQQLRNEAET
ncbi:hypothetical protein CY34DRAFT_345053 [Suillus luteus UH-Slu-Lm8-n1]|uniref:Uncharacterized protein n=1 Tax=Suillus luteus UH-Slu-Lm8-n1 TaxID=930992 RepID=A0A0D0BM47_9AGAM|nr:hypothetical protein CY34DRAFT_345053 [Suillus luteus UH-Slu-Lm8-n1]